MLDCVLSIQNSTPLVGIDLGSTTAKLVLVEQGRVTWCRYERHRSKGREAVLLRNRRTELTVERTVEYVI